MSRTLSKNIDFNRGSQAFAGTKKTFVSSAHSDSFYSAV